MKNHFDFFVCTTSKSHKPPNTGLDAPRTPNAIEWNHNYAHPAPRRADWLIFNHFKGEPHDCCTPG